MGRRLSPTLSRLAQNAHAPRIPQNVVSIFIQPPSIGSLIERMRERGDSEAEIGKRLLRVPMELDFAPKCDYVIVNDSFEHAAEKLYEIVAAELRGERAKCADVLRVYRFVFNARIVPFFGDEALHRDPELCGATAAFSDDLPHYMAFRLLSSELEIDIPNLTAGDNQINRYLPPVTLEYGQDENGERVTYTYCYMLDERIEPPAGWSWTALPEALHTALLELRSEA